MVQQAGAGAGAELPAALLEHGPRMATRPGHRAWLAAQADALIAFHGRGAVNPTGGFFTKDAQGRPVGAEAPGAALRQIHDSCRMVHCMAAADLLGHPFAAALVDHGIDFLASRHRDHRHGGYHWGVDATGAPRADKQAYGHAFVLLAAASAGAVGHPGAAELHADVLDILMTRFWDAGAGLMREEFAADWQPLGPYRGQNSNMHMTEALMAAHETWEQPAGGRALLDMALAIAEAIIGRFARAAGWVVPEHFVELEGAGWQLDRDHDGDPMFRPAGTTPGHALEWARLLVQLWHLDGQRSDWLMPAAEALFATAVRLGWNARLGGFHYTLGWDGAPHRANRYWWPCAEGAAAAAVLGASRGGALHEAWYRRIWGVIDAQFIDHAQGGWWHELGPDGRPAEAVFAGKPDLYHALQACLVPLLPPDGSVIAGLARAARSGG